MKSVGLSLLLLGAIFLETHSLAASAEKRTLSCPVYTDFYWIHKNIGPYEYSEWIGKGPKGWSHIKVHSAQQPIDLKLESFSVGLDDNKQERVYCNYTITTHDGELFSKSVSFRVSKSEKCWKSDHEINCIKSN